MRRYLLFLPSLLLGVLAAVWLYFRPFPYAAQLPWWGLGLVALGLVGSLLGAAHLLERFVPSFSYASKLLERALGRITISVPLALLLALASSGAEELFFRGALLPVIGVWGQAFLFGLMHPAPRKAWSYTVFTFVAGLAFGYATLVTGSLWPSLLAHFVINLQGFLELRRGQQRRISRLKPPRTVHSHSLRVTPVAEPVDPSAGRAMQAEETGGILRP